MILRHLHAEVLKDSGKLLRGHVLRGETIAATDNSRVLLHTVESVLHVEVKGLTGATGLLSAVEDSDVLHGLGHRLEEVLYAEGTEEVNLDHADLAALGIELVDHLLGGFTGRAHADHDVLSILCAVVVEEVVVTTGDLAQLVHVVLNGLGDSVVEGVGCLTLLEVDIPILRRTTGHGRIGGESAMTELLDRLEVNEGTEILHVDLLDLLDLVRGTEAVEEVEEGHTSVDRREVRHSGHILSLLYRVAAEHSEAGGTAGHHVLVITKDREGMTGDGTCCDVEDTGEELAGDLVHVRDHQEETLRCSKGGRQRTSLQRTVDGTGGTGLTLHLLDTDGVAEEVFTPIGCPLVHNLCHRRGGSDGVDGGQLREHIRDMRRSCVAITGHEFLFFTHI